MPTAFLRSPADSLAGVTTKDKLRRKRRGLLLQEDSDQDIGAAEGRTGPQGSAPNMKQNRDIQAGSGSVRPQDTKTGAVGQEPSDRDEAGSTFPPEGDASRQEMSEGEVQSAVHKMTWDAIEYIDQELSPFRALASKYYQGEPFGDEEEGRSQVVMTDLRDTVLMIMPSLMRVFFGAEYAVEYGPTNPQQVEMAEAATDYVNQVVIRKDNRGALAFYEWFKDALVKRLGIVKYWYDDSKETRAYSASFLSEPALTLLRNDPEIRVESVTASPGSMPNMRLYDVEYVQTKQEGRIRFTAIPPEEYLFTRGARTTTHDHSHPGVALFVGHRTELTRSQLLEIGVSEEDIEEWAFKDVSLDHNQEEIARQHIVKPDTSAIGPIATQKALYIEGYPYMDVDGDGVAELRKIVMLGPSYHVISNEPAARRPFAVICPDPEPHTIIGQGISDYTMDLQRTNSVVVRQMLNSLALAINNRVAYVDGDANLEDILNPEIGSPIRMRSMGAVQPLEHRFVGGEALGVLQYLKDVKEERTGITKASAGLEAGSLQSSSRVAVAATLTSAQQHIELIARMFAEMGVAPLMQGILELLVENQAPARMVKLRGQYIPLDPRSWDVNLSVNVRVAIGGGLDDDKWQVLADTAGRMEQIFQFAGLQNPMCTVKQYRDTLVKMLKLKGRMDADEFYTEVDPNWQPPQKSPDDPNMVIAQAEAMKAQAHVQKQAEDAKIDIAKHQLAVQKEAAMAAIDLEKQRVEASRHDEELRLREKEIMLTDERERRKIAAEIALEDRRLDMEHQRKIHEIGLNHEVKKLTIRSKDSSSGE